MSQRANVPRGAEGAVSADAAPVAYRSKFILYAVGTAVFLGTLAYLVVRIANQWPSLSKTRIEFSGWFAASVTIYAISHVSTALAWPNALRAVGEQIPLRSAIKIGLVSQVGKYLPGNIAHYVGRAALGKTVGVKIRASGLSTAVEIACALIAALILAPGVLVSPQRPTQRPEFLWTGIAAIVLLAIFLLLVRRRPNETAALRNFGFAALCITVSLFLYGASAYSLLISIGAQPIPFMYVTGAFGLAWISGFLTPGAPGGLGVRETIFVALLTPYAGSEHALACAILHRLVTATVDFTAGLVGYAWLTSDAHSKM